ncbi:MAG: hypothetical protein FJ096_03645 [Deltaproteobacteria bacterium]|nr:hypothetical protein [Deltaproteobacteria bacterium]
MDLGAIGPYRWSTPADAVRFGALGIGVLFFLAHRRLSDTTLRRMARLAPFVAAALSAGYVVHYLRGGPRVIDATAYWLEARTLAEGRLALPLYEPEHALLGRFLVRTEWHGPAASVIFPPGWPAVLALGFLLGAPLAVGPIVAAALTYATSALAREVSRGGADGDDGDRAAATAALLSTACVALRYHTADTMSHGWSALCVTTFAVAVMRANGAGPVRWGCLAGLSFAWLFATRPVSAFAAGLTTVLALCLGWLTLPPRRRRGRLALAFVVGAIGPLLLWFAYQRVASGSFFGTAQASYYATSDGPPGCFRYGFGKGIGCLGEHRDFVEYHLGGGYGLVEAFGTTMRRLTLHVTDVANLGLLFLLVPLGAARRTGPGRYLALGVVAQILGYAPFYFDGSYPGGGARMFADALPLEHVLVSLALVASSRLASRFPSTREWTARVSLVLSLMAFGFALGSGADHAALRERDGGRPMFDERIVRASIPQGRKALVFVDTDHGFLLGRGSDFTVVRANYDALDRVAWEAHGRPPSFQYRYRFEDGSAEVVPRSFEPTSAEAAQVTVQGESLWPPFAQSEGFAWPSWGVPPCASRRRALALEGSSRAAAVLRLPTFVVGRPLTPVVIDMAPGASTSLELWVDGRLVTRWDGIGTSPRDCRRLAPARVPATGSLVELRMAGPGWALDVIDLSEIH